MTTRDNAWRFRLTGSSEETLCSRHQAYHQRSAAVGAWFLGTIEAGEYAFDLADRHRFARRSVQRDLGGLQQVFGVEAGGKSLQPHRRNVPIAVAARPFQQIKLASRTLEKRRTQLMQQIGIAAGRRRKGCIQGSMIE